MFRIGIGWDRHRLVPGRPCIMGGVSFPESALGLEGHSDGDVLCHAVSDALLGAASLGDIGRHFPDTDPTWAGADSRNLLSHCVDLLHEAGFQVGNVDCTLIAEQPLIAPRAAEMIEVLAGTLAVPPTRVSVKATRGEGLGPEGRQDCVTAMAVALVTTEAIT